MRWHSQQLMLKLDFSLIWRDERVQYIQNHLNDNDTFSPSELTTISDYILWGRSRETGLNGLQEGFDLASKWNQSASKVESLDALIESPTFNENSLRRPTDPPTRQVRTVFSRTSTRKNAPAHLLPDFEALWRQIDETEFIVQQYELDHGKRKTPIRDDLLERFAPPEKDLLISKSRSLSPYHFLKLKRELVDLRTQQYILKDSYSQTLVSNPTPVFEIQDPPSFGDEIEIRPFNLVEDRTLFSKIWRKDRFPEPSDFGQEELEKISKHIWRPEHQNQDSGFFDFQNRDHLYVLFGIKDELENASDEGSNFELLKQMIESYTALARLEPIHRRLLNLKLKKESNQLIADKINKEFGKKYSPNYISTLYVQKCLQGICDAAAMHAEVMRNIFFPENFKTCKDCGRTLLLNETNFVKRARSSDGFSPRCKICEKLKRKGGQK